MKHRSQSFSLCCGAVLLILINSASAQDTPPADLPKPEQQFCQALPAFHTARAAAFANENPLKRDALLEASVASLLHSLGWKHVPFSIDGKGEKHKISNWIGTLQTLGQYTEGTFGVAMAAATVALPCSEHVEVGLPPELAQQLARGDVYSICQDCYAIKGTPLFKKLENLDLGQPVRFGGEIRSLEPEEQGPTFLFELSDIGPR